MTSAGKLALSTLAFLLFASVQTAPSEAAKRTSIFTRVQAEPVLEPTVGFYDDYMTASPSVVRHQGRFRMVYTGHCQKPAGYTPLLPPARTCPEDAGVFLLGASSRDGTRWHKRPKPVLRARPSLRWMSEGVAEAELVRGPDGWFYLFFTGLGFPESRSIGVARSRSPFGPWDLNRRPIVRGTLWPPLGTHKALAPSVSIESRRRRVLMWFNGTNQVEFGWDVFAARSSWPLLRHGRWSPWRPVAGGERVLVGPYGAGSADPSVIRDDAGYRMFFTCGSPKFNGPPAICQATSDDGLRFRLAGRLHALRPRRGAWDENLETAFVLPRRGAGDWMFYAGYRDSGYRGTSLGLAIADGL